MTKIAREAPGFSRGEGVKTMHPDTRRLVQLTADAEAGSGDLMDLLLARNRATDRRDWLQAKGHMADVAL